jgi:hypothetical protein
LYKLIVLDISYASESKLDTEEIKYTLFCGFLG